MLRQVLKCRRPPKLLLFFLLKHNLRLYSSMLQQCDNVDINNFDRGLEVGKNKREYGILSLCRCPFLLSFPFLLPLPSLPFCSRPLSSTLVSLPCPGKSPPQIELGGLRTVSFLIGSGRSSADKRFLVDSVLIITLRTIDRCHRVLSPVLFQYRLRIRK